MSTVTCYECKKTYNYQEDGFCPRCGSFNQPRRGSYIVDANGDIVRTNGINEASHENSFVHKEYHAEERQRKQLGLDRKVHAEVSSKPAAKKGALAGTVFLVFWFAAVALMLFAMFAGNI